MQNVTLDVRCMLTDFNWGIHKETDSGFRGITVLYLMHKQPKCQAQGSKSRSIHKLLPFKDTVSFIIYPQTHDDMFVM